jgi:RHS repeat-associated protein
MATISDRKLGQSPDGDTIINYYHADLLSAQDYYPGGMLMPGRSYSSDSYRFGFNGKENDNEGKGTGNQQDYGMRIYDPRAVRFLSVDPITKDYPELTPYQFASNSTIAAIDLDGLEMHKRTSYDPKTNTTLIQVTVHLKVKNSANASPKNIVKWAYKAKKGIEKNLSWTSKDGKTKQEVKVDFDFFSKVDPDKDFYLDFVKVVTDKDPYGGKDIPTAAIGKVDEIGDTQKNRIQLVIPGEQGSTGWSPVEEHELEQTAPHEILHTGGVEHDEVNKDNMMYKIQQDGAKNKKVTPAQHKKFRTTVPEK